MLKSTEPCDGQRAASIARVSQFLQGCIYTFRHNRESCPPDLLRDQASRHPRPDTCGRPRSLGRERFRRVVQRTETGMEKCEGKSCRKVTSFFRSWSVLVDICRGRDGGGMEGRRMRRFVLVEGFHRLLPGRSQLPGRLTRGRDTERAMRANVIQVLRGSHKPTQGSTLFPPKLMPRSCE